MKPLQRIVLATLAALLWIPAANAAETPLEQALRARLVQRPLILAQYDRPMPTCRDDEKEMPRGSSVCREGRLMLCNPRGAWEDTRKPC
jgi:hypothetical protein